MSELEIISLRGLHLQGCKTELDIISMSLRGFNTCRLQNRADRSGGTAAEAAETAAAEAAALE